jgi:hypothetical protein
VVGLGKVAFSLPINDNKFKLKGAVPILLADNIQIFDVVYGRFNGRQVWFEGPNRRYKKNISDYLRNSLVDRIDPSKITMPGISPVEKRAYSLVLASQKPRQEDVIKNAVTRAGGIFKGYKPVGDDFVIKFEVDGETHKSRIDKSLMASSPGICLHGDSFDLQSLVGVIREGQNTGQINRVGINR